MTATFERMELRFRVYESSAHEAALKFLYAALILCDISNRQHRFCNRPETPEEMSYSGPTHVSTSLLVRRTPMEFSFMAEPGSYCVTGHMLPDIHALGVVVS